MARSRMIKPEFFDDEKLSECSVRARLLFIALWVNSDDFGVVKGNPKWLKAQAFPYDDITAKQIKDELASLEKQHCIVPFRHNGESFYYIRNWDRYQKVNRPSKSSRNPEPPEDVTNYDGGLTEGSMSDQGGLIDQTETETETETESETESISSELHSTSEQHDYSHEPPLTTIPLVSKEEYPVYGSDVDEWQDAYPAVDVLQELKNIRQWNLSNPKKRKTKSGIRRHVTTWLARKQDQGGSRWSGPARKPAVATAGDPDDLSKYENLDEDVLYV